MTDPPRVSVVLTVYNGDRYLAEAVDSIRAQTLHDIEVIVVDDGSTDGTTRLLDEYAQVDPRLRVFHRAHVGQAACQNFGCGMARAAYIALMDADDVSVPRRLAEQLSFMEAHPQVGVLGSNVLLMDEHGRALFPMFYPSADHLIRRALLAGSAFAHPAVMLRKKVFEDCGGYREVFKYAEDYDLWLRASERCELANLSQTLLRYRFHTSGISFRNVQQQILSMVGAELSARSRRRGQVDNISTPGPVTLDDLQMLGVGRAAVLDLLTARSASRAAFMVSVGKADDAIRLLDWATTIDGQSQHTRSASKARVIRSVALYQQGLRWKSLEAVACAARSDLFGTLRVLATGGWIKFRGALTKLRRESQ